MHRHPKYIKNMRSKLKHRSIPIAASERLDLSLDVAPPLLVRADAVTDQAISELQLVGIPPTTTVMTVYPTQAVAQSSIFTPQASSLPVPAFADKEHASPSASASPMTGSYIGTKTPLSETTRHLLIIAGTAGITIALSFVGFLFWKRRRSRRRDRVKSIVSAEKEPSVSAPLGTNWGTYKWDVKSTFAPATTYKEMVDMPEPAYTRPSTSQSNRAVPTRAPFAPPNKRAATSPASVYIPRAPEPASKRQPTSQTRSASPELPMQRPDTRPSSPSQVSSVPPYLAHMNGNPNPNVFSPPKVSRFSWTNSQAPKTPMDTNKYTDTSRYSGASDAESVARYRTIESWVGQQAGRYEEARIQDRIQLQLDEALGELNHAAVMRQRARSTNFNASNASMKTIPLKDPSSVGVNSLEDEEGDEITDLSLVPEAARTKSVKRTESRKAKHHTNESDMTVFRAHPGTKVDIPGGRYIPSVILDRKFGSREGYRSRDSYRS